MSVWTNQSGLNQTLAGGLALQRHLHHFKQVLIRAAKELLVCSDPDLRILVGGAVQLQQHRSLEGRKLLSVAGVRVTHTSRSAHLESVINFGNRKMNGRGLTSAEQGKRLKAWMAASLSSGWASNSSIKRFSRGMKSGASRPMFPTDFSAYKSYEIKFK